MILPNRHYNRNANPAKSDFDIYEQRLHSQPLLVQTGLDLIVRLFPQLLIWLFAELAASPCTRHREYGPEIAPLWRLNSELPMICILPKNGTSISMDDLGLSTCGYLVTMPSPRTPKTPNSFWLPLSAILLFHRHHAPVFAFFVASGLYCCVTSRYHCGAHE